MKFFNDLSDDRLMTPSGFSETHSKKRNADITPNLGTLSVTIYGIKVVISVMSDSIKKFCSTFEKMLAIYDNIKIVIYPTKVKKKVLFLKKKVIK